MVTVPEVMEAIAATHSYARKLTGLSLDLQSCLAVIGIVHLLVALLILTARSKRLFSLITMMVLKKTGKKVTKRVVAYAKEHSEANNPDLSLAVVEQYAQAHKNEILIHVGPQKGSLLDKLIASADPLVALELGAFFGYSAVRMGRLLKRPGAKVYSMEIDPECADASREFVQFCGLEKRVEVFTCSGEEGIAQLRDRTGAEHVDLVFIDHWKDLYLPDLKRLEASGLMRKGTVIVADNIVMPGVPDYTDYVINSPLYDTSLYPFSLGDDHVASFSTRFSVRHDAVAVSVYKGDAAAEEPATSTSSSSGKSSPTSSSPRKRKS